MAPPHSDSIARSKKEIRGTSNPDSIQVIEPSRDRGLFSGRDNEPIGYNAIRRESRGGALARH